MKKATKAQIKKERNPVKVAEVIKKKGYPSGVLPRGKVLHHVIPVALGGKTTPKNTKVLLWQNISRFTKIEKKEVKFNMLSHTLNALFTTVLNLTTTK